MEPEGEFDPVNIISSNPVYVRKQVYYQGHAATTYSVNQATNIIDHICKKYNSEDCAPFALKIIEGGQIISVAEDNGEFTCGAILANALKKLEGYNVLVVVTRCVKGCFVTDMIQPQKRNYIKMAAEKAIELLFNHLQNPQPVVEDAGLHPSSDQQMPDITSDFRLPERLPSRMATIETTASIEQFVL
jgi:hypothetical protein|eukprot:gene11690-8327_t